MADELQCLRQHQQRHSALVRVVDAAWLRRCGAAKTRLEEGPFVINPCAPLGEMRRSREDNSDPLENRDGSRTGGLLATSSDGVAHFYAVIRNEY
jgi:hypothetical protein